ncbi:MAG: hypothetical protein KA957_09790, partial [Syntrophaceae bacterium]|nr:hypothetical protein [Syntrophaceae bacterium]
MAIPRQLVFFRGGSRRKNLLFEMPEYCRRVKLCKRAKHQILHREQGIAHSVLPYENRRSFSLPEEVTKCRKG